MHYNKVICVGRNYAAHAAELNNPLPSEPILFMKPATALVPFEEPINVTNLGDSVHYEIELAVLLGKTIKNADAVTASNAIDGIGLALDLTLRDVQQTLKDKGLPWEIAKSFDGSCPISAFVPVDNLNLAKLDFSLEINGQLRQQGHSANMLTPIVELIEYASQHFTLCAGDILITGTPAGVGALQPGDNLKASFMNGLIAVETKVV